MDLHYTNNEVNVYSLTLVVFILESSVFMPEIILDCCAYI